jgi:parvulin-like peptidyl-prolyl isomerase
VADSPEPVVARHGAEVISSHEFLHWLRYTERGQIVREMLADRVVLRQARARGWEAPAEELQRAVDELRRRENLFRATQMHQWLAERGMTPEDLELQTELRLLREQLKREVCPPAQVERTFAENRRQYDKARLAQIVVADSGVADELRLQLEEGKDFAELAARYSLDLHSKSLGGELGLVERTSLPAAVEAAVFAAQAGDLVGPVATEQGCHLLRVRQLLIGVLTPPLFAAIQNELFGRWLAREVEATHPVILPRASA